MRQKPSQVIWKNILFFRLSPNLPPWSTAIILRTNTASGLTDGGNLLSERSSVGYCCPLDYVCDVWPRMLPSSPAKSTSHLPKSHLHMIWPSARKTQPSRALICRLAGWWAWWQSVIYVSDGSYRLMIVTGGLLATWSWETRLLLMERVTYWCLHLSIHGRAQLFGAGASPTCHRQ